MSRATPILALGIVFFLAGIALFGFAQRMKDKAGATTPRRKSDERGLAVEKQNYAKMRIAGGVLALFGAGLAALAGAS
jgi:uncharacterized protein YjeT (DUF2065 family)